MQKVVFVEGLNTDVVISRRKGTRSIRIGIKNDKVMLSVPYGVTEGRALNFLYEKEEWIKKHIKPKVLLQNGDHIGKSWRIVLNRVDSDTIKTRLKTNEININYPETLNENDSEVQNAVRKACERALKQQSERLLPQRLEFISEKLDIDYRNLKIKKLKSRWGSCDNHKNITLNIYLTQLPWELIDYVIIHELAHTKHQHHQKAFWDYMEELMPDYKQHRKALKQMPTDIMPT